MDQGCGSGACGCAGTSGATLTAAQEAGYETLAALVQPVARVNGVALHAAGEAIDAEVLRQRACTELLRQAAQQADLLAADDVPGQTGPPVNRPRRPSSNCWRAHYVCPTLRKKHANAITTPIPPCTARVSGCSCATCCLQ